LIGERREFWISKASARSAGDSSDGVRKVPRQREEG
jgi:hypothetical protein